MFHRTMKAAALALLALFTIDVGAQVQAVRLTDQVLAATGRPIVNGYVYIGAYQQDPVANPLSLFSDPGLTTPIANPQRTDSLGRFVNDIFIAESRYSYQIKDASSVTVEGPKNRQSPLTAASGISKSANIAALKALTGMLDGQVVEVVCYDTCSGAPDGGGGPYKWVAANSDADDGRTTIAPNAGGVGRWKWVGNVARRASDAAAHLTNMTNVACWGDSLTAGSGGTPFPTTLRSSTGLRTYNGGVGGETSTQIKTRLLADSTRKNYLTVIWAGRNNYTSPSTVLADIAAMVAALGHDGYLVLGVINGDFGGYERVGGEGYGYIVNSINAVLATTYGRRYLDIRATLIANYNPGLPQDVTDVADGIVPTSLRSDTIHLNTTGYNLVASTIKSRLSDLYGSRPRGLPTSDIAEMLASPTDIGSTSRADGSFTSVRTSLVNFDISGNAVVTLSGDNNSVQFPKGLIGDTHATYDLGRTAIRWKDLYLSGGVDATGGLTAASATLSGAVNAASASVTGAATMGQARTLVVTKSVAAGASADLFRTGGSYHDVIIGILTVNARNQSGAGHTIATYSLSMMGSGTAIAFTPLSSQDFGAGAATFTLTETRDSPTGGQNKLTINNTSAATSDITVSLLLLQASAAPVAL